MMSGSTSAELSELLSQHFDTEITLPVGEYMKMELHDSTFYLYCSPNSETPDEGSAGIIIAEQTGEGLVVLGSILPLLRNFPSITIKEKSKIEQITFGDAISLEEADGTYLVLDKFERLVAWGELIGGKFTPYIDKGSFLRYES